MNKMNYTVEFDGKTIAKFVLPTDAIIFAEALETAMPIRSSSIIVASAKGIHHRIPANSGAEVAA